MRRTGFGTAHHAFLYEDLFRRKTVSVCWTTIGDSLLRRDKMEPGSLRDSHESHEAWEKKLPLYCRLKMMAKAKTLSF